MSDEHFLPPIPDLMSAVRARNLSRHYKGFADSLRRYGFTAEADQAERDAHWWLQYAAVLSRVPPGATEEGW